MTNWAFCIDSDGCVMDTMTYKHTLFFGPIAADIFEVKEKEAFLKDWNHINLYSKTRGINRFTALVQGLELYNVPGIEDLKHWVHTTKELSNQSLKKEIEQHPSDDLKKALEWSEEVNRQISQSNGLDKPFENALSAIEKLHEKGQVIVVSSANKEAVEEEWTRHGFLDHVDELYCQDQGKKEDIIAKVIKKGADASHVVMIGDSPGDLDAAKKNDVFFYPILVNQEKESWKDIRDNVLPMFLADEYATVEEQYIDTFWKNLEG